MTLLKRCRLLGLLLALCFAPGASDEDLANLVAASMEKLARWQGEWHRVASEEAHRAVETGAANSMEDDLDEKGRASAFLDCAGLGASDDGFWNMFHLAIRALGPRSPEATRLAYWKWNNWEKFVDGMDAAGAFDGRVVVALPGEYHQDGTSYYTRIESRRDWVQAMQKAQWQQLFGRPPEWSPDNLEGFMPCPVGFVMVQYVIFLVHKLRSKLPPEDAQINLDSMVYAFVSILDSFFDHLESSTWNMSSFDLAVNINNDDPEYYPYYADFARARPPQAPNLPPWREAWPEHTRWQAHPSCQTWRQQLKRPEDSIRVAFLGEHGPSNLEHLSALQAALGESCRKQGADPPSLQAGHFFTYLWQLQGLADSGSLQSSLRITWDAFWGDHLTVSAGRDPATSKPLWTVDQAVWTLSEYAAREPFLRAAELMICSEPLWLCVLLNAALRSRRLLTRASAAGRAMCLLVDFDQVFGRDEVENYWPYVRLLAQDSTSRGALSATSRMTVEMLAFQAGVRAPYVPCLSLNVAAAAQYAPTSARVLFFRSSTPPASPFMRLLRLIALEMQEPTAELVFMSTAMSYAEIASFRAVVMLPHIPSALRLSDVYAMGMPLFIPEEPFIHKFIWPDDPMPLWDIAVDKAANRSSPPHSPLDFQADGNRRKFYLFREERNYWLQYTEWQVRPHLLRFSSARDLLVKARISEEEAFAVSERVRRSQAELKAEAMEYWQAAMASALAED